MSKSLLGRKMEMIAALLASVMVLSQNLKAQELSDVSFADIKNTGVPGTAAVATPTSALAGPDAAVYLDTLDPEGHNVQICSFAPDGTATVSVDCGGWFSKKYARSRSQLIQKVSSYDGVTDRDSVLYRGALMEIYYLYADGGIVIWNRLDDTWFRTNLSRVVREVPAGRDVSGFKKGQVVCVKADREFDEETAETGVSGLFQPFPYFARKGSALTIEALFPGGVARMRVKTRSENYVLVRLVDLALVEACEP